MSSHWQNEDSHHFMSVSPDQAAGGECNLARFSPSFYMDVLRPYEEVYKTIQGILFHRRPVAFTITISVVELLFTFVYNYDLGFLSLLTLSLSLYFVVQLVFKFTGYGIIARAFPPIDEGQPHESNRIYPLLPFCQRLSHISSTVVDALVRTREANKAGSIQSLFVSSSVFGGLFVFFALCGSFWPIFVIVNIVLLAPGIIMYPAVFPYTQPYILKFTEAMKYPYYHAQCK
jgi:hypothetical protein